MVNAKQTCVPHAQNLNGERAALALVPCGAIPRGQAEHIVIEACSQTLAQPGGRFALLRPEMN